MSLAQSTLITRIRRLLDDDPFEDRVTTSNHVVGSTVTVSDGTQWAVGNWGEYDETPYDQFLVRSIATHVLTVKNGHHNTTDTAHAIGVAIKKEPAYQGQQVIQHIDSTIQELWPYAWKAATGTVAPTTAIWYNGAATWMDLISATQLYGGSDQYVGFYGSRGSGYPIAFSRNIPATLCGSGVGLRFPNGFYDDTNDVNVTARALITTTQTVSGTYDDLADGLLAEVVAMGAAAKAVAAKDIPRVGEDTSVGDATVRPQDRIQTAAWFEAQYRKLLHNYNLYLRSTAAPMGKY